MADLCGIMWACAPPLPFLPPRPLAASAALITWMTRFAPRPRAPCASCALRTSGPTCALTRMSVRWATKATMTPTGTNMRRANPPSPQCLPRRGRHCCFQRSLKAKGGGGVWECVRVVIWVPYAGGSGNGLAPTPSLNFSQIFSNNLEALKGSDGLKIFWPPPMTPNLKKHGMP